MDWHFFGVIMTLTGATVILSVTWAVTARIRADTKKRALQSDHSEPGGPLPEEVLSALTGLEDRLERLEARIDFTERLLEGPSEPPESGD